VLRYCATIIKDSDDAEDIVQQAFFSLWQKKDSISIHTSARAYLYKTVYNASLDFLKHIRVKKKYEKDFPAPDLYPVDRDNAEKELQEKIRMAISDLPEACGRIFRMSKYDHLKYREIAGKLNISEKTVENQMSKALKLLREALQEYIPLLILLIFLYND
jgi:RNA polymerase sigma-70 factor (ECF subfamily)